MARSKQSPLDGLLTSPKVRAAAQALIDAVAEETSERALAPRAGERVLKEIARLRGRPLLIDSIDV